MYSNWNSDGNIHATGNITFGGDLVLGDDDTDSVIFNSDLNSDLLPDVNDVSELGTNSKRWNQLHTNVLHSSSVTSDGASINTNVIQAIQTDTNLNFNHTVNNKNVDIDLVLLEDGTIGTVAVSYTHLRAHET